MIKIEVNEVVTRTIVVRDEYLNYAATNATSEAVRYILGNGDVNQGALDWEELVYSIRNKDGYDSNSYELIKNAFDDAEYFENLFTNLNSKDVTYILNT
jgi:hypothetical protein